MKLLPSSLAARTVLLVIAIVAVAEWATFSMVLKKGDIAHVRQTTQFIVGQIRLLQIVLPGLDEAARHQLEERDVGEPGLQLVPDGASVPEYSPRFGFARDLAERLGEKLDEPVILRHDGRRGPGGLWIGFMAGGERWWLVLPPPRFKAPGLPQDLWLWLAATLAILMLIAGLFVRGIVRPLASLGQAVDAIGDAVGDSYARKVEPEGPSEVRRLAVRHNTMVDRLTAADAERREMLAGLTHDLRAPLARLRVRLALLENDAEREGLTRDTNDMERIVNQCLAFLRSEEGAQAEQPILIADAVSDEVARQRELGRPVEIAVSDAAATVQVAIAHGDLQRLLDNLIDNALQYGAPPVEIGLTVERPGFVSLRVCDHGAGIPPEQRARAFEAFAQIDPARATRGSCGLGLAIVRRVVKASGGEVVLGEAAGGGLEVELRLPVAAT
ncbi:MAG: ATP-binding protein [Propionivibrio sp.]